MSPQGWQRHREGGAGVREGGSQVFWVPGGTATAPGAVGLGCKRARRGGEEGAGPDTLAPLFAQGSGGGITGSICVPPPCLGASQAACVSPPLYPGTSRTVCVSPLCPQHPAFYPRDPTGDQCGPSAPPVHPQCAPSVPPARPQHGGGCTKAVRTPQQLHGSRSRPPVPDVPRPGLVLGGQHRGAGMAGTGGGTRPALLGGPSGTTTATAAPPATGPVPPRLHPRPAPAWRAL